MPVALREPRYRRQNLGDSRTGRGNSSITECMFNELTCGLGVEVFLRDDAFQFLGLLGHHEALPLNVHLGLGIDRLHELNDEILLVAQAGAGVDDAFDGGADFLVFPRALFLQVLLDQQQDVIDVDFHLLDELDLENHVIVDRLLLRL
ncbi:hypothetical protein D3C85_1385180 [compost metagenome]